MLASISIFSFIARHISIWSSKLLTPSSLLTIILIRNFTQTNHKIDNPLLKYILHEELLQFVQKSSCSDTGSGKLAFFKTSFAHTL